MRALLADLRRASRGEVIEMAPLAPRTSVRVGGSAKFWVRPNDPKALVEVGALLRGKKDFEGAVSTWKGVAGRYAGNPQAPRARLLLAETLEDDLGRSRHRIPDRHRPHLELVAPRPRPAREHGDVAAIRVDVEVVRIEVRHADLHAARSQ